VATEKSDDQNRASNSRLNWLRAAVLGANDGIVSVSSIILGVAGATDSRGAIFTAGLAGLVAGAFSMGVGEYVSVSSQRDTERAYIRKEKRLLKNDPDHELDGLAEVYQAKGLSKKTALQVAQELTAHDPLKAHLEAELNLDEDDLNNPWHAAYASLLAFTFGGIIPFISVLLAGASLRFPVTFIAVLIALTGTGYLSATVGGASRRRAVIRVVFGGAIAMAVTYGIGHLFGAAIS
jgi:vacuolar iron transporter family protein